MVKPNGRIRWRILRLSHQSIPRNLAVEEALARTLSAGSQTQPTVRLWADPKGVVVGRFQEVSAEADVKQCELSDIQIARRFTGGGTVFHDEGTLNLTVATQPRENTSTLKFQEDNVRLVANAFRDLSLTCSTSENSILIDGRKVCGAAAAIGRRFALWHCSILVDTDTQLLERVLRPSRLSTKSRFVRSRWHEVTTLAKSLGKPIRIDEVADVLERAVETNVESELETGSLSESEEGYVELLYSRKYLSNEWNMNGNRGYTWDQELPGRLTQQLPCAFAPHP